MIPIISAFNIVTFGRPRKCLVDFECHDFIAHLVVTHFFVVHPHNERITDRFNYWSVGVSDHARAIKLLVTLRVTQHFEDVVRRSVNAS